MPRYFKEDLGLTDWQYLDDPHAPGEPVTTLDVINYYKSNILKTMPMLQMTDKMVPDQCVDGPYHRWWIHIKLRKVLT